MSSTEVANKLPIDVPQDILDKNPKFKKLLLDLAENHIDRDGTSKQVNKDFLKVQATVEQTKLQYFEQLIIYSEIKELLFDHKTKQSGKTPIKAESTSLELLEKHLKVAEAIQFLKLQPNSDKSPLESNLFGLSESQVRQTFIDPKLQNNEIEYIQKSILSDLSQRLSQKCVSLYNFYMASTEEAAEETTLTDKNTTFLKSLRLAELIGTTKVQKQQLQDMMNLENMINRNSWLEYYQILGKSLELLANILRDHQLSVQYHHDQTTSRWLQERFQTMVLKLKLLKHQYLTETYTLDTVPALKKVRELLEQEIKEAMDESQNVAMRLQEYESVGMGFDKVVKEYAQVMADIKEKSWALQEIRKDIISVK